MSATQLSAPYLAPARVPLNKVKAKIRRLSLTAKIGMLACLPLLCIPKAGIKISGLPITVSYLALGIACCLVPFVQRSFKLPRQVLYAYLATLPLAVIVILKMILFAPLEPGYAAGLIIAAVVIPFMVLVCLRQSILQVFYQRGNVIRVCIVVVALFGITDFISRNFLSFPLDVPYVTENSGDAGKEDQKYNTRGDYTKLFATYGNGNIYGVCMLMMGPICFALGRLGVKEQL